MATKPKRGLRSAECWTPRVKGGIHFQGRRWGGHPIYDSAPTFASYGVAMGPDHAARDALIAAVPQAHRELLATMDLVVDDWGVF